jgi:uncharacterized protein YaaR (DUF327 family)
MENYFGIRDSLNQVTDVKKSKFRMHPGNFSGSIDEDLTEWLTQYDRACRVNQWETDDDKGRFMPCFFVNAAALWYGNLEATTTEKNLKSYKHVVKELKKTFDEKRVEDAVEFKLRNRKQGDTEDVATYYHSIVNLCRRSNANMSNEAIVRHLIFGLKPELVKDVMLMNNDTPKSFYENALKVERAQLFMPKGKSDKITETLDAINKKLEELKKPRINQIAAQPSANAYSNERSEFDKEISQIEYGPKGNFQRSIRCYICNKIGHKQWECWYREDGDTHNYRDQYSYEDQINDDYFNDD